MSSFICKEMDDVLPLIQHYLTDELFLWPLEKGCLRDQTPLFRAWVANNYHQLDMMSWTSLQYLIFESISLKAAIRLGIRFLLIWRLVCKDWDRTTIWPDVYRVLNEISMGHLMPERIRYLPVTLFPRDYLRALCTFGAWTPVWSRQLCPEAKTIMRRGYQQTLENHRLMQLAKKGPRRSARTTRTPGAMLLKKL